MAEPSPQFPVPDRVAVRGVVFFARMLDKIRLQAAGRLPPGYHVGPAEPSSFDARFCRFWEVDHAEIRRLVLAGLPDEAVFDAVFGTAPLNGERVRAWNAFLLKRGLEDEVSAELEQAKRDAGWGDRSDIRTFVDFHDVDEGRAPVVPKVLTDLAGPPVP